MKILIKIGSSLINKNNKLNLALLEAKTIEISNLFKRGNEIVLVTSGAVASGMEIEHLKKRPTDILKLQLLSGEGQVFLMKHYQELFSREDIIVSQVLLTHHNFDTREEKKTIVQIINAYLKQKTIPIINENDLINKEELEHNSIFTDNDILSALVAESLGVNLAIILTNVAGLYDSDPKLLKKPRLIEEVNVVNKSIERAASKETSYLGTGGMYSKVIAAKMMNKKGIDVIVADGNLNIGDIIANKVKRTLFKRASILK